MHIPSFPPCNIYCLAKHKIIKGLIHVSFFFFFSYDLPTKILPSFTWPLTWTFQTWATTPSMELHSLDSQRTEVGYICLFFLPFGIPEMHPCIPVSWVPHEEKSQTSNWWEQWIGCHLLIFSENRKSLLTRLLCNCESISAHYWRSHYLELLYSALSPCLPLPTCL